MVRRPALSRQQGAHAESGWPDGRHGQRLAPAWTRPLAGGIRRGRRTGGTRARHRPGADASAGARSEEHTSELQSLMRISYAVFCLKKKKKSINNKHIKLIK